MMNGKIVYVMTPYSKVERSEALGIASRACKKIKQKGFVPLSPVLLFDSIYDNDKEYEDVMDACFSLLCKCEYYYYTQTPHSQSSNGMTQELTWAKELHVEPLRIEL